MNDEKPTKVKAERFTAEERDAMKERAKELRLAKKDADAEADVLAKIAEMPPADRDIAERLHALIKATAPDLSPKSWYGQPAYYRNSKVLCFFQAADKFKTRYPTLGFDESAELDDGTMWPTAFALTEWNAENEAKITALLKKALG